MPPEKRDPAYLWDMREAVKSILDFVRGSSFASYERNELMKAAVERKIEIIGEAAKKISPAFKNEHPEIPWSKIIAQRNVIAHEYGDIKHEKIWQLVQTHLPQLATALEKHIPPLPPELD